MAGWKNAQCAGGGASRLATLLSPCPLLRWLLWLLLLKILPGIWGVRCYIVPILLIGFLPLWRLSSALTPHDSRRRYIRTWGGGRTTTTQSYRRYVHASTDNHNRNGAMLSFRFSTLRQQADTLKKDACCLGIEPYTST